MLLLVEQETIPDVVTTPKNRPWSHGFIGREASRLIRLASPAADPRGVGPKLRDARPTAELGPHRSARSERRKHRSKAISGGSAEQCGAFWKWLLEVLENCITSWKGT